MKTIKLGSAKFGKSSHEGGTSALGESPLRGLIKIDRILYTPYPCKRKYRFLPTHSMMPASMRYRGRGSDAGDACI